MIKTIANAVIYTWLYNNTRGSLLLTTTLHAAVFLPIANTAVGSHIDTLVIQVAPGLCVAIAVTAIAGPERLSRTQPKQVQA